MTLTRNRSLDQPVVGSKNKVSSTKKQPMVVDGVLRLFFI